MKVFVVEQNFSYQEIDEEDMKALHVLLTDKNKLVSYTRIINREYDVTFERVLVVKDYRGKNFGRKIVQETINKIKSYFLNKPVKISAQNYLVDFYQSFGFKVVSDVYLEDRIPHIDMLIK